MEGAVILVLFFVAVGFIALISRDYDGTVVSNTLSQLEEKIKEILERCPYDIASVIKVYEAKDDNGGTCFKFEIISDNNIRSHRTFENYQTEYYFIKPSNTLMNERELRWCYTEYEFKRKYLEICTVIEDALIKKAIADAKARNENYRGSYIDLRSTESKDINSINSKLR